MHPGQVRAPRLLATGLWLSVTAGATGMVWMATSLVAADVTDRSAPVIAPREVASALESGAAKGQTPAPATTARPTTTVPVRSAPATTAAPPTTRAVTPTPTTLPAATPSTVKASPATSSTTSTTQFAANAATYSTAGGVVRVSCNGILITLLSAIPNNGFAVQIVARGPANVDVRFVGLGQTFSVQAVCFGQPIRYYGEAPYR